VTQQRRLVVMRHARAEPFAATDQSRPLTERGRIEAAAAGEHLADLGIVPDHAVLSPATRVQETWAAFAAAVGTTVEPVVDAACYQGNPDLVLEALRVVPEQTSTLVFIGHNPTASSLCHLLDDGDGDPTALRGLLGGFPTGALAVFEVAVGWCDLGPETGRLVDSFSR
jgi:phosphohistidine phosphatase